MPKSAKLEIVLDYLQSEFPDYSIVDYLDETGGYTFRLLKGEQSHLITVQSEFLAQKDISQINTCLQDFRVASVLRDVGEFQVLISNSGCIFV